MGRVIHFEIHADDPDRAVGFYTEVFGWTVTAVPGMEYWLLDTGPEGEPGINGAILRRPGARPEVGADVVGAVITVSVDDVDATVAAAQERGARIALDKVHMPGIGHLVYLIDPEHNVVGALQPE